MNKPIDFLMNKVASFLEELALPFSLFSRWARGKLSL